MLGRKWAVLLLLASLILVREAFFCPQSEAQSTPVIVLTAFGTSTAAADTYDNIEKLTRERFPGYEIRWAFTSQKIREKLKRSGQKELKDLTQTLNDLKAAGKTRIAIQSLHVVPGQEWEEMLQEARQVPDLKLAIGKPLLSSPADRQRLVEALAAAFPKNLKDNAIVLVGHGSPHPDGEAAYVHLEKLFRSRFPKQNVFLGVVEGKPEAEEALAAVKKSHAKRVIFVPLMVVAGDHMENDIMGDEPDSWKSQLSAHRSYQFEAAPGLGFRKDVVAIFLDHLDEALRTLGP